jgi:hypothetical protein
MSTEDAEEPPADTCGRPGRLETAVTAVAVIVFAFGMLEAASRQSTQPAAHACQNACTGLPVITLPMTGLVIVMAATLMTWHRGRIQTDGGRD